MTIHNEVDIDELAEFFKVFCDKTRLKILDTLLSGDKCVKEISNILNISQSAISHQLKNLRNLKLVKTVKNGQNVTYSIIDEHIKIILQYGINHIKEK